MCFVGRPRSFLLAEFIAQMIGAGHYSITEALVGNGF